MLDVLVVNNKEKPLLQQTRNMSYYTDRPIKSFIKSLSWRIVGTIDTMAISYLITGKVTVALSIGSIEVVTKTILYYIHERTWAHIHRLRLVTNLNPFKKKYGIKGLN
ncbi:MAG: DUF2061 domain-containing protein [Bacteroidales bacterium]